MKTLLALTHDLFFAGKLQAAVQNLAPIHQSIQVSDKNKQLSDSATLDRTAGDKTKALEIDVQTESEETWRGLFVRNAANYEARLNEIPIDLALIDLQATQVDCLALIAATTRRGVPVLAFGRHTDPQSLRQARQAGAVRAVPNSVLVTKFAALLTYATDPTAKPVSVEADITDTIDSED